MIFEIVEFQIKQGMEDEFIAGTIASRPLFEQAEGFGGLELHQQIENPSTFIIKVKWESVQHHMDLQKTALYPQIRDKVKDCFSGPPRLQHSEIKATY